MRPPLLLSLLLLGAEVRAGIDPKLGYITADDSEFEGHEGDFFKFVSRPDIQAPRWQVDIHEPAHVSPGYWFVAPYEHVFRPAPLPAWVGPHIYDRSGGLIWSGAAMFQGSDSYDFRLSDFGDKRMMTFAYRDDCAAIQMDSNYTVVGEGKFAQNLGDLNMHDLNVIENGTRALVLTKQRGVATEQVSRDVGLQKELCHAAFDGFKLVDTTKDEWEALWEWSTFDHIPLTESTYTDRDIEVRCSHGWDYLHLNSVDKCPDGNYLLSARHSDTIYKINGTDGSIIWRLGGKQSDFKQDFEFSRQHDIRCREQDGGKYTVSFLDNAKGHDSSNATNDYSRGVIVDLHTGTKPMTANLQREFAHPAKDYATSRGNLEIMDNGNVFLGWAKQCLQSEYTPAGDLVMEAKLVPEFLSTYRSYKYPFRGEPTRPPDVHSEVFANRGGNGDGSGGKVTTHVYVSWNGATEVEGWRVYRSDSSAAKKELVAEAERSGFETLVLVEGLVRYVVLEAVDGWGHGMRYGRSGVVMTVHPPDWVLGGEVEGLSASDEEVVERPAKAEEGPVVEETAAEQEKAEPVEEKVVPEQEEAMPATEKLPAGAASPEVLTTQSDPTLPFLTFLAGFATFGLLLALAWLLSKLLQRNNSSASSAFLSRLRLRRPGRGPIDYLPLAESEKEAELRDSTPSSVLRTRERSESKVESTTSIAPLPMHIGGKGMHRRGESVQRVGWGVPPTP